MCLFHVIMRWLLAGCCGLALISLSVALKQVKITQKPRFYGIRSGRNVTIFCQFKDNEMRRVTWHKADEYNAQHYEVKGKRISTGNISSIASLNIRKAHPSDSGIYFCQFGEVLGPGTYVKVVKHMNLTIAQYRTNLKDGLIIFQGLLLAVCIAAILLRKHTMVESKDYEYEEPAPDHIYEGLAIETCGGGLYEELSVYAQAEGAEAPWERE